MSLLTAVAWMCIMALLIAGCAGAEAGIVVQNPMARATPPGVETGAAYMTIVNRGQAADRLLSVSSPAAKMAELHESVNDNGVMKMEPRPEGFEIPAGGTLELKPGGKHIMLMGLVAPLEAGKKIEITLVFEKAGQMKVEVPVQQM